MSYTPPAHNAVDFSTGTAYSPPSNTAVDFDVSGSGGGSGTTIGVGIASISAAGVGTGSHGVLGSGDASVGLVAAGVAVHARYHLVGEVREAGSLINRRVRVYLRSTGALVAEQDTSFGRFDISTGGTPGEYYLVPINMDSGAVDWAPPCANRVLSVLVTD